MYYYSTSSCTPADRPQNPLVTSLIPYDNTLNSRNISWLYRLKWEPPGNTDRFILANYSLQIGKNTTWIERSKTEYVFHISLTNKSVTNITCTFIAVSTCGTTSADLTLNITLPHLQSVSTTSTVIVTASAAPQTSNFQTLSIILALFLFIAITIIVVLIAIILVCLLKRTQNENIINVTE